MLEYRNYKSLMINKKLVTLNEIKITINEQLQNNVEEEIIKLYI